MGISSQVLILMVCIDLGVYNPPFDACTYTASVRAGSFVHARRKLGKGQRGSNWSRHDRAGIFTSIHIYYLIQLCRTNPSPDRASAIIFKHN